MKQNLVATALIGKFAWFVVIIIGCGVAGVTSSQKKEEARRSGTFQGIEVRVESFRIASEFKPFPDDKNSPVIEPPEGMTLCVVKFSVSPLKDATVLKASQFAIRDSEGAKYKCAFTSLYNLCEGRKEQSCEFPFNVNKDVSITTFVVGDMELSLKGLAK